MAKQRTLNEIRQSKEFQIAKANADPSFVEIMCCSHGQYSLIAFVRSFNKESGTPVIKLIPNLDIFDRKFFGSITSLFLGLN